MQNTIKKILVTWVVQVGSTLAGLAYAGSVILSGDDLTDHGSVNPEMLYLVGTGASNDLDTSEGAALTANAGAIAAFVASGGDLGGMNVLATDSGVRGLF